MNNIHGIVKLTSPLHVASFDKDGGGRYADKNLTPVMSQHVFADGVRYDIPYFPANDLRGRLRREAARFLFDALRAQGTVIDPDLYRGLTAATVTSSPENNKTVEELQRSSRHIYMGLFGGGTRMLESNYAPSDMVPVMTTTITAGMVPKAYEDIAAQQRITYKDGERTVTNGYDILNAYQMLRRDDLITAVNIEDVEKYLSDLDAVVEYQINTLEGREDRKKAKAAEARGETVEEGSTKKKDIQNIYGFEAIAPGVPMYFNLDFGQLTDAQVGLLVSSLCNLLKKPLGGVVRAGMGRTDPRGLQFVMDDERFPLFDDEADELALSPRLQSYVDAMESELEQLDVDEIRSYFMPAKEAKALLAAG